VAIGRKARSDRQVRGDRLPTAPSFRRSCIRLPALKCGKRLSGTMTSAPFFGFRAGRPRRTRTLNVPMPRISTRSPRASAAVITSRMMLTVFASPGCKCVFPAATRSISCAFITCVTLLIKESQAARPFVKNIRPRPVTGIKIRPISSICLMADSGFRSTSAQCSNDRLLQKTCAEL
jgi:hypothetical protein